MAEFKRLPVFVFPTTVDFYADDMATHKQTITLYNPYEFVVNFKVLCTAPWKYRIVDPEGSIKPRCCIDVVIRHISINPTCYDVTDKFRVQMIEHSSKQLIGKKDIPSTLHSGMPSKISESATNHEKFRHFGSDASHADQTHTTPVPSLGDVSMKYGSYSTQGTNYIAIAVAVACIIALMLPSSEKEVPTSLWSIFYLSPHQKMVFAYTLGLVTMVIFRVR